MRGMMGVRGCVGKKKHEKVGSEAYASQMKKDIQLFQYIGSTMTDPSAMAPVL
jgi:hypothetical protein